MICLRGPALALALLFAGCTDHGVPGPDERPVVRLSTPAPVPPSPASAPRTVSSLPPPRPLPDENGDMPGGLVVDGRITDDHAALRHTHATHGWRPIAARMKGPTIAVSTMRAFVAALGSDRTIVLKPGVYIWRDDLVMGYADPKSVEDYSKLSPHYRDEAIVDIRNLTIAAEGTGARILQPDAHDHVLNFQDVEGLTLYNLILSHHGEPASSSGVVRLLGARDVVLDGLDLHGGGSKGLSVSDAEDVALRSSVVWGCSDELAAFVDARDVVVRDTTFVDNGSHDPEVGHLARGFTLSRAALKLTGTTLRNNAGDPVPQTDAGLSYSVLFAVDPDEDVATTVLGGRVPKQRLPGPKFSTVELTGSTLTDNTFLHLTDMPDAVKLRATNRTRNKFDEPTPPGK